MVDECGNCDEHGWMHDQALATEVDDYLERLRGERGLAENTIVAYTGDLSGFVEFAERYGVCNVDRVDRRLLRRYVANLTTRGYAPRSVGPVTAMLRQPAAFTRWTRVVSFMLHGLQPMVARVVYGRFEHLVRRRIGKPVRTDPASLRCDGQDRRKCIRSI